MGTEPQNPLPGDDSSNDKDLANSFADFFQSKIEKICETFVGIEAYNPEMSSIPKLCQFTPMTESEVKTIIIAMKSKSCKSDPIPTHIFKQLLPSVIPTVTKIVNLSLSEGEFCHMWKVAVVRPLLKKEGLEPNKPNYRPVSNLTFMSKIIEKCMLYQPKNHSYTWLTPRLPISILWELLLWDLPSMINQRHPLGMWTSISYVPDSAGFICHIRHCQPFYPDIYS